jgi:hypothetical protein
MKGRKILQARAVKSSPLEQRHSGCLAPVGQNETQSWVSASLTHPLNGSPCLAEARRWYGRVLAGGLPPPTPPCPTRLQATHVITNWPLPLEPPCLSLRLFLPITMPAQQSCDVRQIALSCWMMIHNTRTQQVTLGQPQLSFLGAEDNLNLSLPVHLVTLSLSIHTSTA